MVNVLRTKFSSTQVRASLLLTVLALLFVPSAAQGQATKHPFLWRIDSFQGKPLKVKSWLYGTMHLGDKRLITLPPVVKDAIDKCDALYCELEMGDQGAAQQMMMLKMMQPAGKTVADEMPKELYVRLTKAMKKRGHQMVMIDRFRLWSLEMILPLLDAQKAGLSHSLDQTIYKLAETQKKEVGGLENAEDQINLLASSTPEEQIETLKTALDIMDKMEAKGTSFIQEMLEVYLRGDVDELLAIADESMGKDAQKVDAKMKALIYDRNIGMADGMATKMGKHPEKSYFFAVGALHCPGKKSVLELLEKKGYKLTRINAPKKVKKAESRPTSAPTSKPTSKKALK